MCEEQAIEVSDVSAHGRVQQVSLVRPGVIGQGRL
jgi:hypothetical protein